MSTPASFPLRSNKKKIPRQTLGASRPALSTATQALIDPVQRAAQNVIDNRITEVQLSEKQRKELQKDAEKQILENQRREAQ